MTFLPCGCKQGYERCFDCRPGADAMSTMSGLHLEQLQEVVEQQRSEIDRLRLKVPDRDKLLAEIERLTAKAENWQRIATEITASEHAQRLDNERLRAALQEAARRLIANGDGYGANEATRAQEPKP